MKATFENTMDILVKAYLNDTLEHDDCTACAVGNIIKAQGWPVSDSSLTKYDGLNNSSWKLLFYTTAKKQIVNRNFHKEDLILAKQNALKVIKSTGYTVDQLARVEFAFETADKGQNNDDWMFNGLIAVLEIVAQIHGVDFDGKKVYEDKFTEIFASKA